MVFVVVRKEDGVQVPYALRKHLGAKIRAGIYQDVEAVVLYECGRAEAFVPRVRAFAHRALAADDGHALRSSGPKESEPGHSTMSSNWFTRAASNGRSTRM